MSTWSSRQAQPAHISTHDVTERDPSHVSAAMYRHRRILVVGATVGVIGLISGGMVVTADAIGNAWARRKASVAVNDFVSNPNACEAMDTDPGQVPPGVTALLLNSVVDNMSGPTASEAARRMVHPNGGWDQDTLTWIIADQVNAHGNPGVDLSECVAVPTELIAASDALADSGIVVVRTS